MKLRVFSQKFAILPPPVPPPLQLDKQEYSSFLLVWPHSFLCYNFAFPFFILQFSSSSYLSYSNLSFMFVI